MKFGTYYYFCTSCYFYTEMESIEIGCDRSIISPQWRFKHINLLNISIKLDTYKYFVDLNSCCIFHSNRNLST